MLLEDRLRWNLQLDAKKSQEEQYLEYYQKGEEISLHKLGLWQVYRGVVQLNRLNGSYQEVTVGWITPNHAFGSLIHQTSLYRAVAMTDVYVRHYQQQEIAQDSQLAYQLVSDLSYRLIKAEQMVTITSLKKVESRIKKLLQMLKEEMGHPVEKGIRLTARFTHQNIADAVCTTRVTVTRIMGDLQRQGLLEFDRDRHIVLKD